MFAGEPICPIFDLTILSDATAVQLLLKFLLPSALDSFAPIRYLFTTYSRSSTLISLYFSHLLFQSALKSHGKMMPCTSFSGRESWGGAACGPQYKQTVWTQTVLPKKRCTIFASVALRGYIFTQSHMQMLFFLLCCNYWIGVVYQTKKRKHDVWHCSGYCRWATLNTEHSEYKHWPLINTLVDQ